MIIDMNQQLNINAYKMTLLLPSAVESKAIKLKHNKNQLIIESFSRVLGHDMLILS